jgi:hypothetical protein
MAKYVHWGLPQFADVWTGKAACGRVVDPDNCAAVFITCPQCLKKFKAQNPHAFAPGDAYPSIYPLKNPLNDQRPALAPAETAD